MPALLRHRTFRLFVCSDLGSKPPHVHAECSESVAKYGLPPVQRAETRGLSFHELGCVREWVAQNRELSLERWHEFIGNPA